MLLPPVYALIAPVPLGVLLQLRVRRDALSRRAFGVAALSLSGAAASALFGHSGLRAGAVRDVASRLSYPGPQAWFTRPLSVLVAAGCAALFSALNAASVAVAARAGRPSARWRMASWDPESLILGVTGVCVGVLITLACALSPVLLVVALPPVILLQRSLLHQQLRAAARNDAKTGLLHAAAWRREADIRLNRTAGTGDPLALLLIDVDHFKRVNDTYGHLAGDEVLVGLAAELRQQAGDTGIAGRFGGEEFVVLLPGADEAAAVEAAERLRERISTTTIAADAGELRVTVPVGVAVLGRHGHDIAGLLAQADSALYLAKEAGRNQVSLPGSPRRA